MPGGVVCQVFDGAVVFVKLDYIVEFFEAVQPQVMSVHHTHARSHTRVLTHTR